jgi:hypothetical protein
VDRAELIKWWDLLDGIVQHGMRSVEFAQHVEMVRECLHSAAQWLARLFPLGCLAPGVDPKTVLRGQAHDPRVLFLLGLLWESRRGASRG